jgi:acetyl esterase/lipase
VRVPFSASILIAGLVFAPAPSQMTAQSLPRLDWRVDNLERIGGHPVTVVGAPSIVDSDRGPAVRFDGVDDGLLIPSNPLAGLRSFTVDVLFQPASGGPAEQRFVHFEEAATGNRALVELRVLPGGRWALDTFLRSPEPGLTLLDRDITHTADAWHVARLSYDGKTMRHFVDDVPIGSGEVPFVPLAAGQTSIGMRQNRVSWFKGLIHSIRVIPEATQVIPLWPDGVPGGVKGGGELRILDGRVSNVHVPTLTYVPPAGTPNGTALIVCPGGGYARLAIANEAHGVVERTSPAGMATFILTSRLAEYGHPSPLLDVLRAIRYVRAHATEFAVEPRRIGVMGASAGGHLAASAAAFHDAPEGRTGDALDRVSARPDFVTLLYPVVTLSGPAAHADSRRNLLGPSPAPGLVARLSLETQARIGMPPTFVVHTTEDRSVPVENSLLLFRALRDAQVPVELHVFERGEHGFGTKPGLGTTSGWVDRWFDWMRAGGWLPAAGSSR